MRRIALGFTLLALAAAAGCGGGSGKGASPAKPKPGRTPTPAPIRVAIAAPTHRPKAGAKWPVRIRVSDARGAPIRARLTMKILFGGQPVGKVDNGRVYRFTGTWHEPKGGEITWPAAARGHPLAFQAVVTARGVTVRRNWWISVR